MMTLDLKTPSHVNHLFESYDSYGFHAKKKISSWKKNKLSDSLLRMAPSGYLEEPERVAQDLQALEEEDARNPRLRDPGFSSQHPDGKKHEHTSEVVWVKYG